MFIIAIVVSCCDLKTIGGLTLVCAYQTCTTLQIKYYFKKVFLNSKYTNVVQLFDFFHNLLQILGMKIPIQFQISNFQT
jgi:lipopolysaccharide biosynthesis protein